MAPTVAARADIKQRLNNDGLATLGLASPLLAPAWTDAVPTADVPNLKFATGGLWRAPCAGVLSLVTDARTLGLSAIDGTPAVAAGTQCAVFRLHPQARLRIEREMVGALQAPAPSGRADQSVRPVPALILMEGTYTLPTSLNLAAGDKFMFAGDVSMYDEHGLIVDPFAFAAQLAAVAQQTPALLLAPIAGAAGTLAAVAGTAPPGRFVHLLDLHGRPWSDPPGANAGVSLFSGGTEVDHVGDGTLHQWSPSGAVLAGRADPSGAQQPPPTTLLRFGFSTLGRMGTVPLAWPTAGAQKPVRDTLRVTVTDPVFHLLGNRSATARDLVAGADAKTVAEPSPAVRDGSPVNLLVDGRSCLGFFEQAILALLQGGNPAAAFTSGPILASSVAFDDAMWTLPTAPGAPGRWPLSPAAVPVPGSDATVLNSLAAMRSGATAAWISGSNDVVVTLPASLPAGVAVRLYPVEVLLGTSPDEQPLLQRADGGATITTGAADTIVLIDPFRLGATPVRNDTPHLRADAVVTWLPPSGPAFTKIIGNLSWQVGADVARTAAPAANLLGGQIFKGISAAPMLGATPAGSYTGLAAIGADPVAFIQGIARQLTTDQNPRSAPRLPTMSRTETLLALQLPAAAGPDLYRSVLTGGWLTREIDAASNRLGNPGGAGAHEVHAPGVAAGSQLGYDLWVAALHRTRSVVPTATVADSFTNGPNQGLATNWVLLQANATSAPPAPPATPSSVAGAVLQTVAAYVETPELALIPDDSVNDVNNWIANTLPNYLTMPNQTAISAQMVREVRACKYGRRDAQWALRRAMRHARDLVYIETPLLSPTASLLAGPTDATAAADIFVELATRLAEEPRLRVVILVPRVPPFAPAFAPFSAFFYAARSALAQELTTASGSVPVPGGGTRPRVVIAHPMGVPGRPLVIRTTTVIVDDVWMLSGTSSLSRRGMTFDGANDVVLTDWSLDRSGSVSIRDHRKALMATHLGVGPGVTGTAGGTRASAVGAPDPEYVALHSGVSAHAVFADILAAGGLGKLLPLWAGPDFSAPNAVIAHPASVADPDGRDGASTITTIAGLLGGNTAV